MSKLIDRSLRILWICWRPVDDTPGSGSAAMTGAQGAALVAMVCGLTAGRQKYAEHDGLAVKRVPRRSRSRMACWRRSARTAKPIRMWWPSFHAQGQRGREAGAQGRHAAGTESQHAQPL